MKILKFVVTAIFYRNVIDYLAREHLYISLLWVYLLKYEKTKNHSIDHGIPF